MGTVDRGVDEVARPSRSPGEAAAFFGALLAALPAVFVANCLSLFLVYFVIMPFSGLGFRIPPIPPWFFWLFASTFYPLLAVAGLLAGLAAWGALVLFRQRRGERVVRPRLLPFLLCCALATPTLLLALELAFGYEWVVLGSLGAQGLPVPDGTAAAWASWALGTLLPMAFDALAAAAVAAVALRIFSRDAPP